MHGIKQMLAFLSIVLVVVALPEGARCDAEADPSLEEAGVESEPAEVSLADEVGELWTDEGLSDVERVEVFHRVMMERGLGFVGYVRVYAGRSYLDTFHWDKTQIAEAMGAIDSEVDVAGLLRLAKETMGHDALVSADAMMLAAMTDWEAAEPVLIELSDPNVIREAHVRPIHVHTLSLIAAAKQSDEMMEKLRPILRLTHSEEVREDILCAISAMDHEDAAGWVKDYVETNLDKEFDQAMQTALLILSKRVEPTAYKAYVSGLMDSVEGDEKQMQLKRYRDDPPAYGGLEPFPGAPYTNKGWDEFRFTVQEDGVLVRYRDRFEVLVEE
jgi:hypothetical protein